MDVLTYALAKKLISETADSLGSLKGAPATIKSIEEIAGGHRVTFEWTGTSGAKRTQTMDVMDGAQGPQGEKGADGADGAKGDKGDDGYSPTVTIAPITGGNRVTITDADGDHSFDVMNGSGGGDTSDFNDLTNRPKYLGDAMTNKTDVMGFELIEDHDGCYWYDDAYTWMGAWKKTPGGGATGHGMVVSRGQREIGLIKGDAGGSSSQRWRIPMADKVEDMLAEKAEKATTYTKEETDGKIAEAMTDVDNEHFHPVTVLPNPADEDPTKRPKENHEYILIEYEQDGTTIKSETHYLFYGGAYHQKPTGGISLDGYATEAYVLSQVTPKAELEINESSNAMDIVGGGRHASFNVNEDGDMEMMLAEPGVYLKTATVPSKTNVDNAISAGVNESKAYTDNKTLAASGWGVVRTGVATVTFNNSKWSSSATVDVSELGFSSGADYDVVAQPTTGGTATPWGNAIAFVNADKGASSFSVSSVTMEESLSGTVNVKYTIFAKGYGAVAYTGELPTGGTTGQVLTKRSDADGDYGWQTNGALVTDGDWRYKINHDNTFEAYYSKSNVSLTIQDTSGNFYRSALQTLTLPTGITSAYDATPLHASVNTSHNNYPCFGTLASVATNQVKYYALSGSSRGASPNYIVTAHVFGTLTAKV